MRLLLAILAVGWACSSVGAGDGPTEFQILCPCSRGGHLELFLMNSDGSNARSLGDGNGVDCYPSWSHDGKKIAFASKRDEKFQIWVMDADGANPKQLTNDAKASFYPSWSPDDKHILFSRNGGPQKPQKQDVFVMDTDGKNPVNLTNDPTLNTCPDWSPDGKKIVFSSTRSGEGARIYTMNADGSNVVEITHENSELPYMCPGWSPDGKKLLFAEGTDQGSELHICDADGGHRQQLTTLGGANTRCAWSPDGKMVAFQHVEGDGEALYIVDVEGKNPREVFKEEVSPRGGTRPAWRPHTK
jgi:Tol biopolymer transport system component